MDLVRFPVNRSFGARCGLACVLFSIASLSHAADDTPHEFFEKHVRPLLLERCAECHSAENPESGLDVESLEGLLKGGTRGPSIVPGKPAESLLVSAIQHGEVLKMPPKSKLPADQIANIVQWIAKGADWPDAGPVRPVAAQGVIEPEITEEQRAFWAFQPLKVVTPPGTTSSPNPIDAFIEARLQAAGLKSAPPADKRTLIRRAAFDLLGLPPTPEEVGAFLADESPEGFARVIDRLLESPHYGERWGRHWLDVARYADSNGLDENLAYANAFRYRDYVIAAFNKDKPFDQFVREQLAGDLLPSDSTEQELEQLTATGFLMLGAKMLAEDDPVKMQMDIVDEQVDTVSRAFLGLTFGCARCHDHKYDPLSAGDYYGLAGIFKSTKTMENFSVVARWQERFLASPEAAAARHKLQEELKQRQSKIDELVMATGKPLLNAARSHIGDYLLAARQAELRERLVAQTPSLGATGDLSPSPGVLLLEAENYDRGNVINDTSNYGTGIGVLVNRGEAPNFVEYDIELAEAGCYQFELRYAAASARPCSLAIDGETLATKVAGQVTGGWHPEQQAWHVEGFFDLAAGKHVLRLEQPQFFPHIDKLLLVRRAADALPAGLAPLDAAYKPWPELVRQWREFLAKPERDPQGVLANWRASIEAEMAAATSDSTPAQALADIATKLQARAGHIIKEVNVRIQSAPGANRRALSEEDQALHKLLTDPKGPFAQPASIEKHFPAETVAQLETLRTEQRELDASLPKFPEAMAVSDQGPEDLKIHFRGSHLTLGAVVPRRFPRILQPVAAGAPAENASGRLELASWLTQPTHPLTSRVIVNRVWQWHFGAGIVRSPDNFGKLGETPTHPELLDWLALEFVQEGWSLKALHRRIMLSAAWQMSTADNEAARQIDPENRLWWHFPRRRLEAEEIRDGLLVVSGNLDPAMGGSMLPTANRAYVTSTTSVDPLTYRTSRRSVYLPVIRSALYDVFQAFDFADPSVLNGQRQSTTVAPQALFMMNSTFVSEQTLALADRLLDDAALDDGGRVRSIYRRSYGRDPSAVETDRALKFVAAYEARSAAEMKSPDVAEGPAKAGDAKSVSPRRRAWQSLCRAVVGANEFLFVE